RVRQALALAIDKDALVDQALNGWQTPAWGGFVPPSMPGHMPGISLPCDPERARGLLAEAGFPGGAGFPAVEAMLGANRSLIGEYLSAQWARVLGIDVRWETVISSRFFIHVHERQPQLFLMSWTADYHDPDNFLRVGLSQRSPWSHPRYSRLIEEARRTIDQERRLALFQQADELLMQHVPIIPLHYSRSHDLVKPWLLTGDYPWKNWTILPHDDV
ncbi:MAG TPA: ABC transporter substrate-binding protein, partial [Herpetosiphonaceae bacterium]|nr:ABC transporter substrate-binding protein [Herpetosiphonaceae bacterium]